MSTSPSAAGGAGTPAAPAAFTATMLTLSLTVRDLPRSLAWWRDVLGFALERRVERDGALRAAAMSAGSVRILLNQDDGARGWERVKGEGFSFQLVTAQDVDAVARRIRAAGGTLDTEPADMPWGTRAFRLRDPDGYRLSISSPRPA